MFNKTFYERNLPHWHPPGQMFFLTYRLAGSIPVPVIRAIKTKCIEDAKLAEKTLTGIALELRLAEIQREAFKKYDDFLDQNPNGPYWLKEPEIAETVAQSLHYRDGQYYKLWAYTIMSNHVHVLLEHEETAPFLSDILQRHKSYTGRLCNQLLGKGGQFWCRETYDRVVRNKTEMDRVIAYILRNPVKAKLVASWEKWPFTYLRAM